MPIAQIRNDARYFDNWGNPAEQLAALGRPGSEGVLYDHTPVHLSLRRETAEWCRPLRLMTSGALIEAVFGCRPPDSEQWRWFGVGFEGKLMEYPSIEAAQEHPVRANPGGTWHLPEKILAQEVQAYIWFKGPIVVQEFHAFRVVEREDLSGTARIAISRLSDINGADAGTLNIIGPGQGLVPPVIEHMLDSWADRGAIAADWRQDQAARNAVNHRALLASAARVRAAVADGLRDAGVRDEPTVERLAAAVVARLERGVA